MKIKLIAPHEQTEDTISSAQTFKSKRSTFLYWPALTPPGIQLRSWMKRSSLTISVKKWIWWYHCDDRPRPESLPDR